MRKLWIALALLTASSMLLTSCTPIAPAPATAAPAATVAATAAAPAAATPTTTVVVVPTATAAVTNTAAVTATETVTTTAAVTSTADVSGTGNVSATVSITATAAKTLRLPDLKGRKITAVTGNDFTPLNFVDPATGKAMGWEYDAINEICRRLNCTVNWQAASWDTMIAAVHAGQYDVAAEGITINDERKQQVDFSIPYMTSQQFMLVRAGENRFKTPAEFAANTKLLIGSQAGTTNFYAAVYNVLDGKEDNPRIKLFETFGAAVQALLHNDVDMVLMDAASGRGYIGANPDKLQIIGGPLTSEDYGFIFKPKSDLVAPFDAAIAQMRADGFTDYLNNRWFFLADPAGKDVYHKLPDLKGRKVIAVTGNDFTPLNFVDPVTGKATGWEYEAINEVCRRLNCTVNWQAAAWDTMIAAVHAGQYDVAAECITINDERKQQVDFSVPYMTSQQFMLVRADETRFKTPEEFAANPKLLIGSQAGTTNFYAAVNAVLKSKEDDPRIKLFETFGAAVQALLHNDVDMVLMDAASSRGYIGANPNQLKIVGGPLAKEDYGFIFKPKSDLVAPFNAAIETMLKDGFTDYLNNRWFFLYDPNSK
jgi:ABC-type amino acid transport substrate-binding protein